jgi:hypothetical protein
MDLVICLIALAAIAGLLVLCLMCSLNQHLFDDEQKTDFDQGKDADKLNKPYKITVVGLFVPVYSMLH